jgi:uncharacterized membrane protein YgcG
VTDDAREHWRAQHRTQRLREQKWGPARRAAQSVAFWLALAATLAFAALGIFVALGWATPAFVLFYLALRIKGVRPFEGGGSDVYAGYYGGDSGGGDSGGG